MSKSVNVIIKMSKSVNIIMILFVCLFSGKSYTVIKSINYNKQYCNTDIVIMMRNETTPRNSTRRIFWDPRPVPQH